MEELKDLIPTTLSFELRLKEGKTIPEEYTLILGLKHTGAVVAKSIEGLMAFPIGELGFKSGGEFAKLYWIGSKKFLVAVAQVDLHYDLDVCAQAIKDNLTEKAKRVIILESVPWSLLASWGHQPFHLGLDAPRNHVAHYLSPDSLPLRDTLGARLVVLLAGRELRYVLQLTEENSVNFTDCSELARAVKEEESVGVVESKMRSAISAALGGQAYM